jgi:hypothetical protein
MGQHRYDLHVGDEDEITARDRVSGVAGCALRFGSDVVVFLTPTQESELLAQLILRRRPSVVAFSGRTAQPRLQPAPNGDSAA